MTVEDPIKKAIENLLPWRNYAFARALDASVGLLDPSIWCYQVILAPSSYDLNLNFYGSNLGRSARFLCNAIGDGLDQTLRGVSRISVETIETSERMFRRERRYRALSSELFLGTKGTAPSIQAEPRLRGFDYAVNRLPIPLGVPKFSAWEDLVALEANSAISTVIPDAANSISISIDRANVTFFFQLRESPTRSVLEEIDDIISEFGVWPVEVESVDTRISVSATPFLPTGVNLRHLYLRRLNYGLNPHTSAAE